jgi:hypothetical protein
MLNHNYLMKGACDDEYFILYQVSNIVLVLRKEYGDAKGISFDVLSEEDISELILNGYYEAPPGEYSEEWVNSEMIKERMGLPRNN